MNPDQKLVQSAYEDTIRRLYVRLFEGYSEAGGAPAQEALAEQNFAAGFVFAKRSRDRAISLLG